MTAIRIMLLPIALRAVLAGSTFQMRGFTYEGLPARAGRTL